MEAIDSAAASTTTTTTTTTYTDVITKFKELKHEYYTVHGCMISTLNDDFAKEFLKKYPNLVWEKTYNPYAEADVFKAKINIISFGKPFIVYLHRPIKQLHRWEYEYFFGFGGHNEGFSLDRIIMTFEERSDEDIDIEYLLMTGTIASREGDGEGEGECCAIDEKYIKNTLKLLVLGGYVKYWAAFNKFKEWFKERVFNVDFDTNNVKTLTSFMFEDYQVIE
jgi:hypothetical protein